MVEDIDELYNNRHKKNQARYVSEIRGAYLALIKEVSKFTVNGKLTKQGEFFLRKNPSIKKQINALLDNLYTNVYGTAVIGINSEWELAVEKNTAIAKRVFGKKFEQLPDRYKSTYLSNNDNARKAFIERKIEGLNLSDRVWKYTNQFKDEIELALEHAIGKGIPAAKTARDMQEYLTNKDKLYRRIRQENDTLRLSKAAADYHPGRGMYRSSYKNALRLVANETNFSYERSNELQREQSDYIVGLRIEVSNRHSPIMDKGGVQCSLLQGLYPKDFKWTYKWHVNCQCISFTVLKTESEIDEDIRQIFAGKEPKRSSTSANYVQDTTPAYKNEYKTYLDKVQSKDKLSRTFLANPI